jgi:steroid delta-isomerase-like uncharacterized protein
MHYSGAWHGNRSDAAWHRFAKRECSMNPTDLCRRYVDAWNRHDAEAILGCFALDGRYEDPTTAGPISGAQLRAHAQALWHAFPDLSFEAEPPITSSPERVALSWTMTGTHEGEYRGAAATGRAVSVRGMDLFRCVPEGFAAATGYFDPAAVPRQLGWQVLVQPDKIGPLVCGVSRVIRTGRPIDEGAVGITEIVARSDAEMVQLQELGAKVSAELPDRPGFISLTVSIAGRRLTTMSTWDSVRSLRQSLIGSAHGEAMRRVLGADLTEGGVSSIWLHVQSHGFRRCPQCARMGRLQGRTGRCECGEPLLAVA